MEEQETIHSEQPVDTPKEKPQDGPTLIGHMILNAITDTCGLNAISHEELRKFYSTDCDKDKEQFFQLLGVTDNETYIEFFRLFQFVSGQINFDIGWNLKQNNDNNITGNFLENLSNDNKMELTAITLPFLTIRLGCITTSCRIQLENLLFDPVTMSLSDAHPATLFSLEHCCNKFIQETFTHLGILYLTRGYVLLYKYKKTQVLVVVTNPTHIITVHETYDEIGIMARLLQDLIIPDSPDLSLQTGTDVIIEAYHRGKPPHIDSNVIQPVL